MEIKVGDVVQLAPDASDWAGGMYGEVTAVRGTAVLVVDIPIFRDRERGLAPLRVAPEKVARIGRARWSW